MAASRPGSIARDRYFCFSSGTRGLGDATDVGKFR
jgi:hypothetical protein